MKAALALDSSTAHLDVDIDIVDDTAILRGMLRTLEEIDSIKSISFPISPSIKVDCSQLQLGGPDYTPSFFPAKSPRTLKISPVAVSPLPFRPAWAVAAILSMTLLVVAGSRVSGRWFHPRGTRLLKLAGLITDSKCASLHTSMQSTPDCVRACVRTKGAKYVLDDGTRDLVLSNQQTGEHFAGQRVVARGFLDEITGALQLRSIQVATP
jgi:hypothetical protein